MVRIKTRKPTSADPKCYQLLTDAPFFSSLDDDDRSKLFIRGIQAVKEKAYTAMQGVLLQGWFMLITREWEGDSFMTVFTGWKTLFV